MLKSKKKRDKTVKNGWMINALLIYDITMLTVVNTVYSSVFLDLSVNIKYRQSLFISRLRFH